MMEPHFIQRTAFVMATGFFMLVYSMDKCIMKEERFMYPPLYKMADRTLPSVAIAFILIPIVEFEDCYVEVIDVMEIYKFDNSTTSFAAFSFVCILPINIDFRCENESLCRHGDRVIGNFEIMTCKTSLKSIDYFCRFFHVLSIYLYDMGLGSSGEVNHTLPSTKTFTCEGLKNVNIVVIALMENFTYDNFLSVFQCNTFQQVTTLVISDIPWNMKSNDIIKIFPNLQSLELQNVNIEYPPVFFPWSNETVLLPLNLSRTEYLQNLYASALYLEIPVNEPRRVFNLRYNSIANITEYRFFGKLHMITLENNGITSVDVDLVREVSGLQNLDLSSNLIVDIPSRFFDGQTALRSLNLRKNRIAYIAPGSFQDLEQLKFLDISFNKLVKLESGLFSSLLSLETLHLENNFIKIVETDVFPIISKNIEQMFLDNNPIGEIPVDIFYISSLRKTSLKHTDVSFQNFTGLLKQIHVNVLSQNVLAYDPDKKAEQIREVDLTGSRVNYFYIEKESFNNNAKRALNLLLRYFKFILKNNPIRCDCNIAVLSDFVRSLTIKNALSSESYIYHDWKCVWPHEFYGLQMLSIDPKNTYCQDKFASCPQNCTCYVRYESDVIIVDCRNSSFLSLPVVLPSSVELDLWFQHNNISEVEPRTYFDRVRHFRISNNEIRQIHTESMTLLLNVQEFWLDSNHLSYIPSNIKDISKLISMKLQDNPYVCDCKSLWFKRWVKENTDSIRDWEEITCGSPDENEDGRRLVDTPDDEFVCLTDNTYLAVGASGGCASFLILIIILVTIYKFEIQVLLYMWFGIRPFDRVKYKDVEKVDVMILHNLDITDWVNENILKFLETLCRLKVCEIDRDFVAGYSFNENISHLAAQSKRMLIVLSPSVLTSDDLVRMCLNEGNYKVRDSRLNFYIFVCHQISTKQIRNKYIRKQMKRSKVISSSKKLFLEKLLYLMPKKRNIEDLKIHIELESLSISYTHQTTSCTVFDIFILYGENHRRVFRDLVPKFESTGYTLCLPDREFVPGSSKQANIIGAIKNSRHTLIVLTEENWNDEWLVFGFQTAMERNLQEKYNHLVLLTDNKIDPRDLHTELRNYVSSHVILYFEDSCLWDKIFRSMPLKTRCRW